MICNVRQSQADTVSPSKQPLTSFKTMGLLALKKKVFKGFGHIWGWEPSLSCNQDHFYKFMPTQASQGGSTYMYNWLTVYVYGPSISREENVKN